MTWRSRSGQGSRSRWAGQEHQGTYTDEAYRALTLRGLAEVEEPAKEVRKRSQEGSMKTRHGGVQRHRNESVPRRRDWSTVTRLLSHTRQKMVTWR